MLAAFSACGEAQLPSVLPSPSPPLGPAPTEVAVALDRVGCDDVALELVLPFYEGVLIASPKRALIELGVERLELVYPSPLSIPAAAWRCQGKDWNVVGAALEDAPLVLRLSRTGSGAELRLSCLGSCNLHGWSTRGDVTELGAALGRVYPRPGQPEPLGKTFREVRFYVHRFVADDDPAERADWEIEPLGAELAKAPSDALAFVYGWDPSSVDLGGRSFWSAKAEDDVRAVLGQNPKLSHLAWLNLRSFKRAIPRLGLEVPLPAELAGARWQGPSGEHAFRQHAFEAVEMCLASKAWQKSRMSELERIAALGFRVVQLDEFPIATRWHAEPCLAEGHEHAPGDLAGEWRSVLAFLRELSDRGAKLGLRLTSEEPSAALLDLTHGYVERQANREPDVYGFWARSPLVRTVPLFSSAFGSRTTAYTDADPEGEVPRGWLVMKKLSPAAEPTAEGVR